MSDPTAACSRPKVLSIGGAENKYTTVLFWKYLIDGKRSCIWTGDIVVFVVVFAIVVVVISVVSFFYSSRRARNAKKAFMQELKSLIAATPVIVAAPPVHNVVRENKSMVVGSLTLMEKFLAGTKKPVRFTAEELCELTNNYCTRLGSGGFGIVYAGRFPHGDKIAVKVLTRNSDGCAEGQFMAEMETIGRTHHINVVRLYGFCYDRYTSALVYEHMENGSLDKYLFTKTGQEMIKWEKLHDIAIETAKGIAYLHEECHERIIHYDIKPANILLDANMCAKVGDFGLAKLCNRDNTHVSVTGYRGTPGYSAPEFMLKNYPITHKCDVYSFGMVLFEMVGQRKNTIAADSSTDSLDWFPKRVWDEYEKGTLTSLVLASGKIEEEDREKAEAMSLIALWCVQDSPVERPTMSVVARMLEGGVEIMPPPKPFQYMYSSNGMDAPAFTTSHTTNGSAYYISSQWYKETTPIMAKYEIEIVTS